MILARIRTYLISRSLARRGLARRVGWGQHEPTPLGRLVLGGDR